MAPQAAPPPPPPRSTLQNSNLITERGEYRPASNESETKGQGERSLFIPAAYDLEEKGEEGVRGTKGVKGISVPCISVWGAADVANTRSARNKNVGVRIYRNILVFKIETKRYQSCITVLTRFIVRSPRGSFGSLVASRRTLFSLSTRSRNDVIRGFHTLVFEIIKSVSLKYIRVHCDSQVDIKRRNACTDSKELNEPSGIIGTEETGNYSSTYLFLNEQEELEELLILGHASWIRQQSTIIKI